MNRFEQLIEYVINDEEQKARELFHDIVVAKSREIYESMMAEEAEEELDEADAPVDQNSPDYPTNQEESDDALQYSGGLDGKKSTGQTTVPVIASQEERQVAEGNSFFDLYKAFSKIIM